MFTREKIVDSLINLMQDEDFEKITIQEITENAGICRSTFYYSFKSKEDVIKFQLRNILEENIIKLSLTEDKSLNNLIFLILNIFIRYKYFLLTIRDGGQIYLIQQVCIDYYSNHLEISDKEELYQLYYSIGGFYNVIICWINDGMNEDVRELSKLESILSKNYFSNSV
ncbi:TetR/AcrR family transcriptional regulator [Methanosphaera sp.]